MKVIIQLCILTLILASCKTKQNIPVENVQKKAVAETMEQRPVASPDLKKRPKGERMRAPKIDPEQIIAQLGMDEAQENKFLTFWEKNQAEMTALRKGNNGDRSALREKMMAIREKSKVELEAILSPEQIAQYNQILAKDRMSQRRGR